MEQTALLSNLLRVASASSHQQLLLTAGHGDGFMAVLTRRRCRQAAGEPEQDEHETNPAGQGRQTRTTTGLATQAMCVRRHPASLPRRRHFRSANKVASVYFGNTCPPLPDTPQTHLRDPEFQKKAPNPDAGTGTSAKRRQPTLRPDRPDDKPCHGP
ncbi:hypothetical protein ACCO45_003678 [Purpureocillium lilacinum]|uniref:Uncharacterized protein n=1 Tax=Purpureocillium lilacinum TaxID=33203 RepID=A0ACC4E0J8_PURLI